MNKRTLLQSLEYCKNVLWRILLEVELTPDQRADVDQAQRHAEEVLEANKNGGEDDWI
jgi:hypothetical protein